jgi:RNA polymerase sigma factor (sigma-70 family)
MNTVDKNDCLLWQHLLEGDEDAYKQVYQKYIQDLFKYGMTFTSDRELVADCIQDVFIRIYQNRKRLGQTDNIRLYLLSALKNTLLNAFRKQQVYHQYIQSIETEEFDDTVENQLIHLEYENDLKKRIAACKSLLTHRQQEIIHYRFVEEFSIEEIARLLDINYQSVANIIQRALKKMRDYYTKNQSIKNS